MNETRRTELNSNRKMVDTLELQGMLGSGRKTAVEIGTAAKARITIGRRVFWNVKKVQQYIDSISE